MERRYWRQSINSGGTVSYLQGITGNLTARRYITSFCVLLNGTEVLEAIDKQRRYRISFVCHTE